MSFASCLQNITWFFFCHDHFGLEVEDLLNIIKSFLTGTINRQSHTVKYKLLLFIKDNGEQGATCFGS